jgi:two-component system, LytTR family, response regulator
MTLHPEHIKAIIVDDSAQARKLLKLMIQDLADDVLILGEAENVNEAVELIKKEKPDVVFLDIEMPGKSGLQLVEEISRNEINYEIIFTTAYNEYALKAFRLSAIDYLLKPIDETQLQEAINKIRHKKQLNQAKTQVETLAHNLKPNNEHVLCIPIQNGYEYIPLKEIEYIEADGSYVNIYLTNQKQKTVSKNLKYFETTLQQVPVFMRVHRSYIINLKQLKRFEKTDGGIIIMNNNAKIYLSRERKSDFLKMLGNLK